MARGLHKETGILTPCPRVFAGCPDAVGQGVKVPSPDTFGPNRIKKCGCVTHHTTNTKYQFAFTYFSTGCPTPLRLLRYRLTGNLLDPSLPLTHPPSFLPSVPTAPLPLSPLFYPSQCPNKPTNEQTNELIMKQQSTRQRHGRPLRSTRPRSRGPTCAT